MNACCTLYHIDPTSIEDCSCHCGYVQYESLALEMPKLSSLYTDHEQYNTLEAKLRSDIVAISRLFDAKTKVPPGYYSKAHYKVIKLYGRDTPYLRIPEFVEGTLELYTSNGYLIDPKSYEYKDGFLILLPCLNHNSNCGCTNTCGNYPKFLSPPSWKGCLQAKAKFGTECADPAVELAVKAYLIEFHTYGDIKVAARDGLPVTRGFKEPDIWKSLIEVYLQKKKSSNFFAFA